MFRSITDMIFVLVKRPFVAVALSALLSPLAFAGDVSIGEAISAPCAACHGEAGAKPISNYPILAGQYEKYLLHTLKSYKNGSRNNAIMAGQLAELSERDLQNLAAYYAAQPSSLK